MSGANLTGINFTAQAVQTTWSISGTISPSAGGSGATVTLTGAANATTTANTSGAYLISGLPNGAYTVTPTNPGFAFSPSAQAATVNGGNVTGVNFTATTTTTYSITGNISPAANSDGATVTLSGTANGTTTVNGSGAYSFSGLPAGSYTITPSSQTATFSPTSQRVTISNQSLTGVNFTATAASGQACTDAGSGTICAPVIVNTASLAKHGDGTAADGSWALINHASDTASGDLGCYYSGQVNFALNNLTITMVTGGTYTCSQSNHAQSNQRYLSGSIAWQNLSYQPSEMSSGHVTIEVMGQMGRGWPAIWLLGGSGNSPGAAGCQYSSINHGWDNIDNCNWSSDSSDSAEVDIEENYETGGYTSPTHNKFVNNGSVACGGPATSNVTTSMHLYHIDWSSHAIDMKVDGVDANCGYSSGIPTHPLFLLIENRVNPSGAPPGGAFPTVMTIQYVQVCDGTTCTAPNSTGGNTVFYDNFQLPAMGMLRMPDSGTRMRQ